jgi:hypothetical protein
VGRVTERLNAERGVGERGGGEGGYAGRKDAVVFAPEEQDGVLDFTKEAALSVKYRAGHGDERVERGGGVGAAAAD